MSLNCLMTLVDPALSRIRFTIGLCPTLGRLPWSPPCGTCDTELADSL